MTATLTFTVSPVSAVPASRPGALDGFGFTCSCGDSQSYSLRGMAEAARTDHIRWHETSPTSHNGGVTMNATTTMYAIHAAVETTGPDGFTGTRQVPTFYLHPSVQGILSEDQAVRIALDILGFDGPSDSVHVSATKVSFDATPLKVVRECDHCGDTYTPRDGERYCAGCMDELAPVAPVCQHGRTMDQGCADCLSPECWSVPRAGAIYTVAYWEQGERTWVAHRRFRSLEVARRERARYGTDTIVVGQGGRILVGPGRDA